MKRAFIYAALLPMAACDAILGIEPPPIQDASSDGSSSDVVTTDGGNADVTSDGATLAFCESAAESGTVYFCDDFDSDSGVLAKWDDASFQGGALEQLSWSAAGAPVQGSPPFVLIADAGVGTAAYLSKDIDAGPGATFTFSAMVPCNTNTALVIRPIPFSGYYYVSADPSLLRLKNVTNAGAFVACDSNWHTFKLRVSATDVQASIDQSKIFTEYHDSGIVGFNLQVGLIGFNPDAATVYVDNVLVTP